MGHRRIGLFFLLLTLIAGAVCADEVRVVAIVNDDVITTEDLRQRTELMIALSGLPDTEEVRQKMRNQVMQRLVDETLQLQETKRRKIAVTPNELEMAYKQLAQRQNVPPDQVEEFLKSKGIDLYALDKQIESEMSWSKYIVQRIRPKIVVTDEEIDEAIEGISSERGFDEWQVGEIILPINTPAEEDNAQSLANKLVEQINEGADFDKIAAQFQGQGTVAQEPRHWVNSGSTDVKMREWLRQAQRNQLSAPIRTAAGLHIVKFYDKRRMIGADPAETEVALKQIIFPVTVEQGEEVALAKFEQAKTVASKTTGCDDFLEAGRSAAEANPHNLGRLQLKHLSEEVRRIVSPLPVGQVSTPFRTPLGIHLMMVCERITPRSIPIDRQQIKDTILQRKMALEAMRQMRNLRRDAFVEARNPNS